VWDRNEWLDKILQWWGPQDVEMSEDCPGRGPGSPGPMGHGLLVHALHCQVVMWLYMSISGRPAGRPVARHGEARPEHGLARQAAYPCRPGTRSVPCLGRQASPR